jgi:kinesin family protein 5
VYVCMCACACLTYRQIAYVEVYMEKVRDLLDVSRDNLRVREDPRKGVWLEDLTEAYVKTGVCAAESAAIAARCVRGVHDCSVAATEGNDGPRSPR